MANTKVMYDEVRFLVEDPELTEVYVRMHCINEYYPMIDGWHFKAFPANMSVADIVLAWNHDKDFEDPMLWPLKAPPAI